MEMPAKIDYAVRAALELTRHYSKKRPVPLFVLCKSQNIPHRFLIQLLLRMKNAGIVQTIRGSRGGYYLSRAPGRISLADVFRAVDERFVQQALNRSEPQQQTDAQRFLSSFWRRINDEMFKRLEGITLEEMLYSIRGEQLTYQI